MGASGYALTQHQGATRVLLTISPAGFSLTERAQLCSKCRVRPILTFIAIFASDRALLVDPPHRTYAAVKLSQLATFTHASPVFADAQRVPDLGIVFRPPPVSVTPAGTLKIAGQNATGFVVTEGGCCAACGTRTRFQVCPAVMRAS